MFRILFTISAIALLACGSGETNQGAADSAGDMPPVSAVGSAADEIEIEKIEVEAVEAAAIATQISSCLDLVKSRAFAEAVPVCLEAVSIDPENAQAQAALAKAQAEAAAEGAMAAAEAEAQAEIDGSVDSAADSAKGAAADALGGLGD